MNAEPITVDDLLNRFSLSELNAAADAYWQETAKNPWIVSKPFNLGDAEHILPQMGFLIQGLQLCAGMTVLDFGAGSCYASRILNQMQLRVISVDVSKIALEIGRQCRSRWPPAGEVPEHLFVLFNGQRLDLPDQSVDRIFCLDAFHHVPDQDLVLQEFARVLKPGGIAGLSEPGPQHSKSSEAQREMRSWNVIENDIVLKRIVESSRRCGFTDAKIALATIHPPLVPVPELHGFWANPDTFVNAVRERSINHPIFFLYKGDPTVRDSRARGGLSAKITPDRLRITAYRNEPVRFRMDVVNTSSKTWLASGPASGCVNVGAVLRDRDRPDIVTGKEYRSSLSLSDVEPGRTVRNVEVSLGVLDPGNYWLDLDLVSEYICWFQSESDSLVRVEIIIM